MLRHKVRGAVALLGITLFASSLILSGCGRNAVNPLAPDDAAAGGEPGDEDPGEEPVPFPGGGRLPTGGGSRPAPQPGGTGGAKPGAAKPAGGLKPLPRPTPTKGPAAPAGGGGNPNEQMREFVGLLNRFGYEVADVPDVRMQVAIVNRVPDMRFHWIDSPNLGNVYAVRSRQMNPVPTYEQWKADGLKLARLYQGVSYYVGRRALYRDILSDRYNETGNDRELIFYKRLNRTQLFVSYRADGRIDDFGYFAVDNWQNFLPVPGAFWE